MLHAIMCNKNNNNTKDGNVTCVKYYIELYALLSNFISL